MANHTGKGKKGNCKPKKATRERSPKSFYASGRRGIQTPKFGCGKVCKRKPTSMRIVMNPVTYGCV
tara:strand:- start:199 stop:396 length:198 start_codon:yes stop_codon:yes gene_type:complete